MVICFQEKNIISLVVLLIILLNTSCTHLFYQPTKLLYFDPRSNGNNLEAIYFNTEDNITLGCWLISSPNQKIQYKNSLIVLFHGNAENVSSHFKQFEWSINTESDLLAFDYRGYGISDGKPSQNKISEDMSLMFSEIAKVYLRGKYKRIILVGQSLGGVILLDGLQRFYFNKKQDFPIDLLILDSTFLSYKEIANDKLRSFWPTWPMSPLAYLLVSDDRAPLNIEQFTFPPTLLITGNSDTVVPPRFSKEVAKKIKSTFKIVWEIEDGKHIDAFMRIEYRNCLQKYLKSGDILDLTSNRCVIKPNY